MIPAVAKTLAKILTDETSLCSTEQVVFNPPGQDFLDKPALNVYCYSIQKSNPEQAEISPAIACSTVASMSSKSSLWRWFDISFLITAWDYTVLGEQQLLSEALASLSHRNSLQQDVLPIELQNHGQLVLNVSSGPAIDAATLWNSLGLPLRPALYITVRIPIAS
jgi:hypothetical protein